MIYSEVQHHSLVQTYWELISRQTTKRGGSLNEAHTHIDSREFSDRMLFVGLHYFIIIIIIIMQEFSVGTLLIDDVIILSVLPIVFLHRESAPWDWCHHYLFTSSYFLLSCVICCRWLKFFWWASSLVSSQKPSIRCTLQWVTILCGYCQASCQEVVRRSNGIQAWIWLKGVILYSY